MELKLLDLNKEELDLTAFQNIYKDYIKQLLSSENDGAELSRVWLEFSALGYNASLYLTGIRSFILNVRAEHSLPMVVRASNELQVYDKALEIIFRSKPNMYLLLENDCESAIYEQVQSEALHLGKSVPENIGAGVFCYILKRSHNRVSVALENTVSSGYN